MTKQQQTNTIEELEKGLRIDEHALEHALRDHPELFFKVSNEVVMSISRRDEAKQTLEEIEAGIDLELRKKAAMKEERTTEGEIASQRKTHPTIIAANKSFLEARHEAAQWAALKEAFEQRSYALSKLSDLYIANYYSNMDQRDSQRPASVKNVVADRVRTQMNDKRRERVVPSA